MSFSTVEGLARGSRAARPPRGRHRRALPVLILVALGVPAPSPAHPAAGLRAARGVPAVDIDPLRVTPEMRTWVRRVVPATGSAGLRVARLLSALLTPAEGAGFRQVSGHTATASEAFTSRRADCVAFALLVVALSREARLPAYFVVTTRTDDGARQGDLTVARRHLAAAYDGPGGTLLLDFGGPRPTLPGEFRRIADRTAVAIFYSNRGTEQLLADRATLAARWLEAAVGLDPELPDGWVNLGVVRRRLGQLELARRAYLRALAIDPQMRAARRNLVFLRALRALAR